MPPESDSASSPPLGSLEYELTDELAFQIAVVLFDHQARTVKGDILRREGVPPAAPLLVAIAILLIAQIAALIWGSDSILTLVLFGIACLVQLLLLYKFALYFWPPFARWYLRRASRRMVRRLRSRTIQWTFFEDRLETKSAQSERRLPWTELKCVNVLAKFWNLSFQSGLQLVVPTAQLPDDLQALLRRKAMEVGGQISND